MTAKVMTELTRESVMREAEFDANEFDDCYEKTLRIIRDYGTIGVETMLKFLVQELHAGREDIE